MERSIRIRLGLAAPILGIVYFYLLVLLIGLTSSTLRPSWWIDIFPNRYVAADAVVDLFAYGWRCLCRYSDRCCGSGYCARASGLAWGNRWSCGDGARDLTVAAAGHLATRLEQSSHFLHYRSNQAACCSSLGRLDHTKADFSRRFLGDRLSTTSSGGRSIGTGWLLPDADTMAAH